MRLLPIACLSMIISCGVPVDVGPPTGCRDDSQTIALVRSLSGEPWGNWSRRRITQEWPSTLLPLDCEPKSDECVNYSTCPCDRLIARDRVIGGICECCDLVLFSLESVDDRVAGEELDTVILHYTLSTRNNAKDYVKEMLSAAGYSETKGHHEAAGESEAVSGVYIWPSQWSGVHNSITISIRESSEGWTVYAHWGRVIIPSR